MFGRVFLGILTVISLLWLGYATYDRVNQGKQFSPEYVFSQDDGELLIVLNPTHKMVLSEQFNPENEAVVAVIGNLNEDAVETIYVSQKRGQLLIVFREAINKESIHRLFIDKSSVQIDNKIVSIGKLNGKYTKKTLYLSEQSFNANENPWKNIHYDKNADGSILRFKEKELAVTDIYIKENGTIEYKSAIDDAVFGTKVSDKIVFASVIPSSASTYEFYETDYLRSTEPELTKSPMNSWLKYGLVRVVINNQEAIITDYIDGQEPIQVLYDYFKEESKDTENDYFKGSRLTNKMSESNGFYAYQLDDFVVISANRSTCETIVADYKLGNTLAQNVERSNEIYQGLPQKVNYRKVDKTDKQSVSIYDNVLLTTVVGRNSGLNSAQNLATTKESTASFVIGSVVKDILIIDEKSFFVTTNDNKVLFFENDKKKWEQSLNEKSIGDAAIIDIYANEKSQLLIATDKKVCVFDVNGNQPNGFPIELNEQTNVQTPLFYRWKGNGFFIVAGTGGRLLHYDNQGRELAIIKNQLSEIEQTPIVWVSANKPFIGIYGNNRFEMLQADTRKSFRLFDAKDVGTMLKLPNEVKLFGVSNNQLVSYDQKGGITRYEKFINAQLISTLHSDKGIVVKDQQQLKLFNSNGLQWGTIKLPFADVSDVQLFSTTSGATFIATIDVLENKVYLWKSNGELYSQKQWDGSKIVRYHNGYLFTVVDNLVVRYSIN